MKRTFLIGLLLCFLVCGAESQAQVKWSAPIQQYPSQWSSNTPPGPIYERNANSPAQPQPYAYPQPGPANPYAYNYQGNYDQQPENSNRGWFRRPKPGFSGNPFLHPPVFP